MKLYAGSLQRTFTFSGPLLGFHISLGEGLVEGLGVGDLGFGRPTYGECIGFTGTLVESYWGY